MQPEPYGCSSYSFGILADLDRENTDTALQQMASETGGEVSTKDYSSLTELADGLLKGDCQAIVLNRAYLDVFDEIDNYANFSSQIREIASEQVEKLVERNNSGTGSDRCTGRGFFRHNPGCSCNRSDLYDFCQWYRYTGRYYSFKSK